MSDKAKELADTMMSEKMMAITTPPPEPFHSFVNLHNSTYNDFIERLNKKRQFLYQERRASEDRKYNAEKLKITQLVDREHKVQVANDQIANPDTYKPGQVHYSLKI